MRAWIALLMACGSADGLPTPAAPPPAPMTLSTTGTPDAGAPFGLVAEGAPAGATVTFVGGTGGLSPGQGYCPPALGGCLDLLPGRGGYLVVGRATADPTGRAAWSTVLPVTFPPGTRQVQAVVVDPLRPAASNALEVAFTAACADDVHEPNDDPAAATPLGAGFADLSACDDLDWYHLTVQPGETVEIRAAFVAADGDLDLELLDPGGYLLDGAFTLGAPEVVTWYNAGSTPMEADLLVYVVNDPTGNGVAYALDAQRLVPAACADDPFEDDDDLAAATPIGAGIVAGRQSCTGDADWFAIPVPANHRLSVEAREVRAEGDVDVALYDDAGAPLTIASDAAVWDATADAVVYAAVTLTTDDVFGGGAPYDLAVDVIPVGPCATDALEPNDTRRTAATIQPGLVGGLQRCDGDEDWYTFYTQAGTRVEVLLDFLFADGDLDVIVTGPGGQMVAAGNAVGDDELVSFRAPQSGTYVVQTVLYADYGPPVLDGVAYGVGLTIQ